MENDKAVKIEPIDIASKRREGYYFFMSIFITVGVLVTKFIKYREMISIADIIIWGILIFLFSYLTYRITYIRRAWNFIDYGIVVTDQAITQYGYYPGGTFCLPRTIPRNKVYDCYLKINTKEKPTTLLQALKTWLFWTPKRLILLGKNGEKVATINASLYSDESIQKLISVLSAKSLLIIQ